MPTVGFVTRLQCRNYLDDVVSRFRPAKHSDIRLINTFCVYTSINKISKSLAN